MEFVQPVVDRLSHVCPCLSQTLLVKNQYKTKLVHFQKYILSYSFQFNFQIL